MSVCSVLFHHFLSSYFLSFFQSTPYPFLRTLYNGSVLTHPGNVDKHACSNLTYSSDCCLVFSMLVNHIETIEACKRCLLLRQSVKVMWIFNCSKKDTLIINHNTICIQVRLDLNELMLNDHMKFTFAHFLLK